MFHSLNSQLSFVALFLCCGLALWKGGPAERKGAILLLSTWLTATVGLFTSQQYVVAALFLTTDAILAGGLLLLAIRYSSWWMGAAMLLQALGLSLHAAYFAADRTEISPHLLYLYVMGKNVASWMMLLVFLAGTLVSWLRRKRAAAGRRTPAPNLAHPTPT